MSRRRKPAWTPPSWLGASFALPTHMAWVRPVAFGHRRMHDPSPPRLTDVRDAVGDALFGHHGAWERAVMQSILRSNDEESSRMR